MPSHSNMSNAISALKELYGGAWYHVKGAMEEFIKRIKNLNKIEKSLLGIEDDKERKDL